MMFSSLLSTKFEVIVSCIRQIIDRMGRGVSYAFPSYAASAVDYQAANGFFTAASERRLYYTGPLSGQPINSQLAGQYMLYPVRDLYGLKVLADTLGGIE